VRPGCYRCRTRCSSARCRCLAWLLALQSVEVADEDTEPPVPPGLANLSASLQAIADFLDIDEDLIAMAAAASPSIEEPSGLAEWVGSVPADEKDALLARVAAGEGAQGPGAAAAPLPNGQRLTIGGADPDGCGPVGGGRRIEGGPGQDRGTAPTRGRVPQEDGIPQTGTAYAPGWSEPGPIGPSAAAT